MGQAQHEIGKDHQQRHKEERDRGARSEVAALNAERKSERRQGLRGVERPAGGKDVDNGHICEGKNEAEKHGNADNGPHHRNDDLELGAPETGAVPAAASGMSLGIAVRPASNMTVENGIRRQLWTKRTEAMARRGSPSHIGALNGL